MRVLFVQPDYPATHVNFLGDLEPLALEMLAAAIEDRAEVQIIDMRQDTERHYKRLLCEWKPDIVGLTLHAPSEALRVIDLARMAKAYASWPLTIIGGLHASIAPETFNVPGIDLICRGPGEQVLREILSYWDAYGSLPAMVPGTWARWNGELEWTGARDESEQDTSGR